MAKVAVTSKMTWSAVASKYGVPLDYLLLANDFGSGSGAEPIAVGQEIWIPVSQIIDAVPNGDTTAGILVEDLDFDLPPQKTEWLSPSTENDTDDAEPAQPLLVAANDDSLVVKLIEEARQQHKKRGVDSTPASTGGGDFIPFKFVAKPSRPNIRHDHGFLDDGNGNIDESKRKKPTASDFLAYIKWGAKLSAAELLRPDLFDATQAFRHFLEDTGTDWHFSYERYAANDRAGAMTVSSAVEDAVAAATELHDMLQVDNFIMQSDPIGVGGSNERYPYAGTENWQKAIGAHVIWLEAHVQVVAKDSERKLTVLLILHAEDRYNFNPGAADIATGTPDAENGRFEVTGLAKEFLSLSTLKRQITFVVPMGPVSDYRKKPDKQNVSAKR